MLNSKGMRELAYLVIVDVVDPIPGADRVETAKIGGWTIMVRKGQFKPGDIAVYFEIDSKVPEKEPFMFLEQKHFKIKTQKYFKGTVISQGLLMSLSDFNWLQVKDYVVDNDSKIHRLDDDTRFVTAELGIKYAIDEDNHRKGLSPQYYKPKIFNKMPFSKLWKYTWVKKLFGTHHKKREGWPVGRFPGVSKTDQERCLPGGAKILTEDGWIQINKLVNSKIDTKVASVDKEGNIVYKKILDYQKFNNTTPVVTIRYPYAPDCSRTNALCCTEDHKILTTRGYIEAKDITTNDYVFMPVNTYSPDVLPIIYGMLLGDSHIANDKRNNGMLRIVATNGEVQLDYLKYKYNIFKDGSITNAGLGSYGNKPSYHWSMGTDPQISVNVRKDWYKNNQKEVTPEVCKIINEAGLAFWYMDDGNLTYRNENKTAYWIRLNTQGFSLEENTLLIKMLDRFGVKAKINKDRIAKDGHQMYRIDISSTEESDKFLDLVAPYICDSMLYKLPKNKQNCEKIDLHFSKSNIAFPVPVLSVKEGQAKNKNWGKSFKVVYDIEVEDTHNFVADNIIVHNCENMTWVLSDKTPYLVTEKCDGTSATYILEKINKKKFKFYVCSRNVLFTKKHTECFYGKDNYYLNMAEKYNIQEKMKNWLNNNPTATFVCWQGEICGPGIQNNPHGLSEQHLFLFHWTDSINGRLDLRDAIPKWKEIDMETVPLVCYDYILPDDFEEFKESADGYYSSFVCDGKEKQIREGYVYYKTTDPTFSFKNVSRTYLLKHNS